MQKSADVSLMSLALEKVKHKNYFSRHLDTNIFILYILRKSEDGKL